MDSYPSSKALDRNEKQNAASSIWNRFADFISHDDKR